MASLQNSFAPEVTPHEAINYTPPEFDATGEITEKDNGAPEVAEVSPSKGSRPKRICGVKAALFWTLLAVGIAVALGVGVGVGVGVGMKKSNSNSNSHDTSDKQDDESSQTHPPPTSTSTSASPAYITSGTHGLASNSCNTTKPRTGYVEDTAFTEFCYVNWQEGSAAWNDDSKEVVNLDRKVVYSFEDCMAACVRYNKEEPVPDIKCWAVTYVSNLTDVIEVRGSEGNCFLKDRKGINLQGSAETASAARLAD